MIILDASAAVRFTTFVTETAYDRKEILGSEKVIAPTHFIAEVGNAYWKYVCAGIMDEKEALRRMEIALSFVDEYEDLGNIWAETFREAMKMNHSIYDAFYFVLARRSASALFTYDKALLAYCAKNGVDCITGMDI